MSAPIRPHPVGGVDYPRTFQELQAWFPDDRACLQYLARLRWPDGFVCPSLNPRVADGEGQVDVRGLRPADVGDRGDDLPSDPDAVVDVVRGHLVPYVAEERDVRVGPAAGPGVRVI